jgi:hypothetical protein
MAGIKIEGNHPNRSGKFKNHFGGRNRTTFQKHRRLDASPQNLLNVSFGRTGKSEKNKQNLRGKV